MRTVKCHLPAHPAVQLAAVLTTLLITGCGSGTSCPICSGTATKNLVGSLTGLVGSRLVLQNNPPRLNQFNGSAANGSGVVFGTARVDSSYAVTVLTQPTNPSQTCTVTNGTGSVGSSGVTNIAVSCAINPPRFLYVANRGSGDVGGYTHAPT